MVKFSTTRMFRKVDVVERVENVLFENVWYSSLCRFIIYGTKVCICIFQTEAPPPCDDDFVCLQREPHRTENNLLLVHDGLRHGLKTDLVHAVTNNFSNILYKGKP